jgi:hypothetical protein
VDAVHCFVYIYTCAVYIVDDGGSGGESGSYVCCAWSLGCGDCVIQRIGDGIVDLLCVLDIDNCVKLITDLFVIHF